MTFRLLCAALISAAAGVHAQDAPVTASDVLKSLVSFFQGQSAFSFDQNIGLEVTGPITSRDDVTTSIDIQRPNLVRTAQALKAFNARSLNNDEGMFLHLVERKQYKVASPEPTLSEALHAVAGSPMGSDVRFIAYLLGEDPMAEITSRMSSMEYLGTESIEGVACHRLRLEEDELAWDVWVQTGEPPLLKRIVPDLTKYLDARRAQVGAGTNVTLRIDFTWKHPAEFPASHFNFDAPADALRVDEFQSVNPESPQFRLLAAPAPSARAETLDGDAVTIAPQKGQVWILDFWAIWCKPCHMLMPVVEKVAKAYEDKGVHLYSINVGDAPGQVSAWLKEQKFDRSHALLDSRRELARAYALESFPMVVLIGQDGTVQTIRSGFGPGYEEQLRKDLDVLVSGGSIVSRAKS